MGAPAAAGGSKDKQLLRWHRVQGHAQCPALLLTLCFLLQALQKWCVFTPGLCSLVRLCGPVDSGPPDSSVHGILQARILKWVAMSSARGSSQPKIEPMSPESPAFQADSLPLSHQESSYYLSS